MHCIDEKLVEEVFSLGTISTQNLIWSGCFVVAKTKITIDNHKETNAISKGDENEMCLSKLQRMTGIVELSRTYAAFYFDKLNSSYHSIHNKNCAIESTSKQWWDKKKEWRSKFIWIPLQQGLADLNCTKLTSFEDDIKHIQSRYLQKPHSLSESRYVIILDFWWKVKIVCYLIMRIKFICKSMIISVSHNEDHFNMVQYLDIKLQISPKVVGVNLRRDNHSISQTITNVPNCIEW